MKNTSDKSIVNWGLKYEPQGTISGIWNAKIILNEKNRYEISSEAWTSAIYPGRSISFGFTANKSATENIVADNYTLSAIAIGESKIEEINYELDTDNDGLPDYFEYLYGTDIQKPDTDDDGLSDSYEVTILGTDPTKSDTDEDGVADGDEDFDDDGLTNAEEFDFETDPNSEDSDYDGLSDSDEIKTHGTDPLKYDSDDDKISDGDEITLGLNPNASSTNGIPDCERTFEQTIDSSSPAFSYINDDSEIPFNVSLELTAAGVAANNISASESGYSNVILKNEAVLGIAPEFVYTDGLEVSEVTVNFEISSEQEPKMMTRMATNSSSNSVEKYTIFKFFDDNNVLLPVKTEYNTATSTVSTTTDELGTYCLIDTEKWFSALEEAASKNTNEPANIVFMLDSKLDLEYNKFEEIFSDISLISGTSFEKYDDIKIYIYYQNGDLSQGVSHNIIKNSTTGESYFSDLESLENTLENTDISKENSNVSMYDYIEATRFMLDECDEKTTVMYHITSDHNVVANQSDLKEFISEVQARENVHISTICPYSDIEIPTFAYASYIAEISDGIVYSSFPKTEHIIGYAQVDTVPYQAAEKVDFCETTNNDIARIISFPFIQNDYYIISAVGLTPIELDSPLDLFDEVDTDGDSLTDWEEVNVELIYDVLESNNRSSMYYSSILYEELPTFNEIIQYYHELGYDYVEDYEELLFYVEEGWNELQESEDFNAFGIINILPINSDPTSVDGDKDTINDFYDVQPLVNTAVSPTDWDFWKDYDVEEYMERIGVTELIFKGVHHVPPSTCYHTSVIIISIDGSDYYNSTRTDEKDEDLTHYEVQKGSEWSEEWENIHYITLGAGPKIFPSVDPLTAGYNREKDLMLDIKVEFVNLTKEPETNDKIDDLLECHNYFINLQDKPTYDLFPEDSEEQNSNSYAVGLLDAVGIDDLGTPIHNVPGYEYPLDKEYFKGVDKDEKTTN